MNTLKYIAQNGFDSLNKELFITVKKYDAGLIVLNYCQRNSPRKHPIVDECRSLILNKEGTKVISRSFDRFFNYGELDTGLNIDWNKAKIKEKLDGSLINVYFFNGNWEISTKSCAFGEAHGIGSKSTYKQLVYKALNISTQEQFNAIFNSSGLDKNHTFIFEITSPENRNVTKYNGYHLWLLSIRNHQTGFYVENTINNPALVDWINNNSIQLPKEFSFKTAKECIESAENLENLEEGYVVYLDNIPTCKIKSPKFVAFHLLQTQHEAYSDKSLRSLVLKNEQEEYLSYFPDEFERIKPFIDGKERIFTTITECWEKYKHIESNKDFAQTVLMDKKAKLVSDILFAMKNKQVNPIDYFYQKLDYYQHNMLEQMMNFKD